jgi:exosortase/archaeosortase family protein
MALVARSEGTAEGSPAVLVTARSHAVAVPARLVARWVSAVVAVMLVVRWCGTDVRQLEARLIAPIAEQLGGGVVRRVGDQLAIQPMHGRGFITTVSTGCSSLAPVLVIVAMAMVVSGEAPRRRLVAVGRAATIVIVGNTLRLVGTVAVGARQGSGALERVHDGAATWFAVAVLVAAAATFTWSVWPSGRRVVAASPVRRRRRPDRR